MPYRIAKSFTVESGHLLTKHPGDCRFPHGHSRTIEIVVAADALDERDMVCDFKALKAAAEEIVLCFDHAFAINTADPNFAALKAASGERIVPFAGVDPTSEAMAKLIFDHVKSALARPAENSGAPGYPVTPRVRLERVRVSETNSSWAEYAE